MKNLNILSVLLLVSLSMPFVVAAMDDHEHGSQGHANDVQSNHDGMSTDGSMFIVGTMISKGVKGVAHLKDVTSTMSKMGRKTTHHFMIAFVDEATGEQIESGTVALKITNPDAKVAEAVELKGMDGHFGVDVVLDMKGEYHFKLGTKLADGKKRKYHFHQIIE